MDQDQREIAYIYKRRNALTEREVLRLLDIVQRRIDKTGLTGKVIDQHVGNIQNGTPEERQRHIDRLATLIYFGIKRQRLKGRIVNYRLYHLGSETLDGGVIEICPVCGKHGHLQKYEDDQQPTGSTIHTVKPFFMGFELLDKCEWDGSKSVMLPKAEIILAADVQTSLAYIASKLESEANQNGEQQVK